MPPHVIQRGRTIIQPVCKGSDLIKRAAFSYFFEGTVNVAYCLFSTYNKLTIHKHNILKNAMRGRMSWPHIEGVVLSRLFRFDYVFVPVIGINSFCH